MLPSFLVSIFPPDFRELPPKGCRVTWPGDDREWLWTGSEWVGLRLPFDGGDSWVDVEGLEDAA